MSNSLLRKALSASLRNLLIRYSWCNPLWNRPLPENDIFGGFVATRSGTIRSSGVGQECRDPNPGVVDRGCSELLY